MLHYQMFYYFRQPGILFTNRREEEKSLGRNVETKYPLTDYTATSINTPIILGDQLYMVVLFWHLAKLDLPVGLYLHVPS